MSTGYVGKVTNWPEDASGAAANDERLSQWGEIPGQVVSFDPVKQTATIKPLYRPKFNGQPVEMPELMEVPVRFTRAGDGALTFPVKPGNNVTLRPQMRSSENYHESGDGSASDGRSFNLSDMEAFLDGGESLSNPISNFDPQNTHLRFDPQGRYGIRGAPDGRFKIEGPQGDVVDMLARMAELTGNGFMLLSTEPNLIHTSEYSEIGTELLQIADKLRGVQLP